MKHANIALFVPHNGCPHQCSFCNQKSITGKLFQPTPEDVRAAAQKAAKSLGVQTRQAEIAFFGGSFTAIERGYMVSLLEAAYPFIQDGTFAGIRLSTRPDAVENEVLSLLKTYGVTTIELGAQSMDDRVLKLNRRGHTARQVEDASRRIVGAGFSLGLQMMTGLYGDTAEGARHTAEKLADLTPSCVRIYPTIVLKGTELGERYQRGEYNPPDLEETVELCAGLLDFFEQHGISVIRLGLHATPELERDRLAGPWHPAFRELCESRRMLRKIMEYLTVHQVPKRKIRIAVHPRYASIACGQKKSNLAVLSRMGYPAEVVRDESIQPYQFRIQ